MGILQRFENRLEQMVTGTFAKAFRSAVQPVELAAALQREVDNSAQILSRDRRLVPNAFHVELSPLDFERLSPYSDTLSHELIDMLREHAQEQRYVFAGTVGVDFEQAEDLSTGRFRVRSQASAKVEGMTPDDAGGDGVSHGVQLEVNGQRMTIEPPGLVVGRGSESDLRINDPGVSRRHAEFRLLPGKNGATVSIVDLGSTNGTLVNGRRVEQATLADGASIKIGNTSITVHIEDPDE